MSAVEQAMAAMDTTEAESRNLLDAYQRFDVDDEKSCRWAEDRLRLIARDQATLERHKGCAGEYLDNGVAVPYLFCRACKKRGGAPRSWPCPDAKAVIDYWVLP